MTKLVYENEDGKVSFKVSRARVKEINGKVAVVLDGDGMDTNGMNIRRVTLFVDSSAKFDDFRRKVSVQGRKSKYVVSWLPREVYEKLKEMIK